MYIGVCVKYSVLLSLLIKLIFGKKFRKKTEISHFIKIVQWQLSVLHAGRRTDRETGVQRDKQTDRWIDWQRDRQRGMTDLIFAFSNMPKHLIVHDLMETPVPSPRSALSIFFIIKLHCRFILPSYASVSYEHSASVHKAKLLWRYFPLH